MLKPITEKMNDQSNGNEFSFTFHCDICGKPWNSVPVSYSRVSRKASESEGNENSLLWESEHIAAYERANHEAIEHFNRCPVCKRWVCDQCFCIMEDRDICMECAKKDKP